MSARPHPFAPCDALCSVKWTALATPAIIGIESFAAIFFLQSPMTVRMMAKVLVTAFIEYATYFYIHFEMLPFSGDGDLFMPIEFQRTLINSTAYDVRAPVAAGLSMCVCVPLCVGVSLLWAMPYVTTWPCAGAIS